ncbi:MAG TPA: hypothetical protein VMF08_13635 [Candidatus Sulfotelmatobacter sp.]|nr:hypothetical protein [Candidatus Sulfotelmatobacter sp.]
MKVAVANLLLKLATRLSAKSEDRGLKIEDRKQTDRPSSILHPPSSHHEMADAFLNARPIWGDDEAKAVLAFLNSAAGQLFSKRIRSVAAHVAIEGARDRANTIHSAGVSAGWNECVRYIHSLSRVSGAQDTPRVGVSDSNNRQQPEDEAALLERLSP